MTADGLNEAQVAEAAGVGRSQVNHVLNGRQFARQSTMLGIALARNAIELFPSPSAAAIC